MGNNVVAIKQDRSSVFAEKVRRALRKTVEGFLEAGRWLETAKGELKHGEWTKMLESIPLGVSVAERLLKIADHDVLSNPEHAPVLPPSWDTLHKLALLPTPLLEAKIKDGTINPKIGRKQVMQLRAENGLALKRNPTATKKKPGKSTSTSTGDQSVEDAIAALVAAIKDKPDSQRVTIMLEVCERAKVAAVEVSTLSDKRAKAAGLVDFIPFKPKKEGR